MTTPFAWLAAVGEEQQGVDWGPYLTQLRGSVNTSWAETKNAYKQLKATREALGLPFMEPLGEGSNLDPDAWNGGLEEQIVDLQAMVGLCDTTLKDAVEGKRRLVWFEQFKNFGIEALPGDTVQGVTLQGGTPVLVKLGTGEPYHASGTVGVFPIVPVVFGLIAVAAIVQTIGFVYAVKVTCEAITAVAQQKTQQALAKVALKNSTLVEQGKATAAEAATLNTGLYEGAKGLQKEQNEAVKQDAAKTKQWTDTLMTLGYVGLGIAGIVTLSKLIPSKGLLANPVYGWVAEMFVDGGWSRNAVVLKTKKEATAYGNDLFMRWMGPTDKRVRRVRETPNYTWSELGLQEIKV